MVRLIGLLALLAVPAASAQTVMDDSQSILDREEFGGLVRVLVNKLKDPYGAQLRLLVHGKNDNICGSINQKNRYGAYDGFMPFVVNVKQNIFIVLPNPETLTTLSQFRMAEKMGKSMESICTHRLKGLQKE